MTKIEEEFLNRYYKACRTSSLEAWMSAASAAKRMYNEKRIPEDEEKECEIQFSRDK